MSFALKNNACGAAHVGLWITCYMDDKFKTDDVCWNVGTRCELNI